VEVEVTDLYRLDVKPSLFRRALAVIVDCSLRIAVVAMLVGCLLFGAGVAMLAGCSSPAAPAANRPLSNGSQTGGGSAAGSPSGWWCYDDGCARTEAACADLLAQDEGFPERESQHCRGAEVAYCAGDKNCMPDRDGCKKMRLYLMGAKPPCIERR
jgi:hypothetical protein